MTASGTATEGLHEIALGVRYHGRDRETTVRDLIDRQPPERSIGANHRTLIFDDGVVHIWDRCNGRALVEITPHSFHECRARFDVSGKLFDRGRAS